jgi:hypothetical protein
MSWQSGDQRTTRSVESSTAAVAFEVLCFLMRDENLQIIERTLAVITPWLRKNILNFELSPFLAHCVYLFTEVSAIEQLGAV